MPPPCPRAAPAPGPLRRGAGRSGCSRPAPAAAPRPAAPSPPPAPARRPRRPSRAGGGRRRRWGGDPRRRGRRRACAVAGLTAARWPRTIQNFHKFYSRCQVKVSAGPVLAALRHGRQPWHRYHTKRFSPGADMAEPLLIQPAGPVLRLRLNRPHLHNAFDPALIAALTAALEQAGADPAVRAVLLEGEGPSFSAGADLNWMRGMAAASERENREDALALARLMRTLDELPRPTLARVHGPAFGGGVGLVACCDIAIGTPKARFGLTEARLGLLP